MTGTAPSHLTIRETAAELGISVRTVRRSIDRGDIPAIRLGRTIRVPARALEQLATTKEPTR